MVYFSYIQSYISFGLVLYGSTIVIQNVHNILLLQKRPISIMFKLRQQDFKQQFYSLGILTVYEMYIMETMLTVSQADFLLPKLSSNRNHLLEIVNS